MADGGSDIALLDGAKDTTSTDTGTTTTDTYVPGSLFDAVIPDVTFEGGKTAAGCYGCITDACKAEMTTCDKDPRCRGLTLCILLDCGTTPDTTCLITCALKYDVTSVSDPVAATALAVADCAQKKCGDKCPAPPGDGGTGTGDAKKGDAETGGSGGGSGGGLPGSPGMPASPAFKTVDPKVIEMLQTIKDSYASVPGASAGVIARYSADR